MNRREQAILTLFYEEGHREVTPAFLAYRMRMRSAEAADLLDALVRDGILDIHVTDEGYITYQLSAVERHRLEQSSSFRGHPGPTTPDESFPPGGTDATPGFAPSSVTLPAFDDGTDGSIWGTGPALAARVATSEAPSTAPRAFDPMDRPLNHPMIPQRDSLPAPATEHVERIPILAAALSLLFPGLGQFYNGEFGKGLLLLFSSAFLLFFYLFWIVWVWSVIDAYMVAEYRNQLNREADETLPRGYLPDP
jgi:TM2 domain-containing membrane protein YozV